MNSPTRRWLISTSAFLLALVSHLAIAQEPQWWTNQKRACHLPPRLAYETWRMQGSPCGGGSDSLNLEEQQRQQQLNAERQRLELEHQKELQRQADERERIRNGHDADRKGLEAANRGDWREAANQFIEALRFVPESAEIRDHLSRANTALADLGSAAEILAFRQRIDDAIAAAKLEALQQNLDDQTTAQRLSLMSQQLREQPRRHYRPSGDAFIGGTGWIVGYNVQNATPEIVEREREMLKTQMALANMHYAGGVDFRRYNFVLGIGASTSIFFDLLNRVVFDEFRNGQFSAGAQNLYNSLKNRQFGELACHSNGAMVCLAALANRDVIAERVVLYGPQITRESLQMWQELLQTNQIKSVQIFVNQNDPVPPFSLALGDFFQDLPAQTALLKSGDLKKTINEISPQIEVQTFSCGRGLPTLDCHDMTVYKRDRRCISQSTGKTVPGTLLRGKGSVTEPPPPC